MLLRSITFSDAVEMNDLPGWLPEDNLKKIYGPVDLTKFRVYYDKLITLYPMSTGLPAKRKITLRGKYRSGRLISYEPGSGVVRRGALELYIVGDQSTNTPAVNGRMSVIFIDV